MKKSDNDYINSFQKLVKIIDDLREKCPWDKNQTINSLRNLTIEEVYELSDAILAKKNKNIEDELGDLLLHIVLYAKIGSEKKIFTINSIIVNLCKKLVYRHPHVYNKTELKNEKEVNNNWENLKLKEKKRKSLLEGVPKSAPPVTKATIIQKKVKNVGFDWENSNQVLEKIKEELKELKNETAKKKIKQELGDLLFSIINYARFLNIDPEEALELTNKKFIKRFNFLEKEIKKRGKDLQKMNLREMNVYWNKSKNLPRN